MVRVLFTLSVFSFDEKGGRDEGRRVLGGDRRQKRREKRKREERIEKKEEEVQGDREATERKETWVRKGRCVIGQKQETEAIVRWRREKERTENNWKGWGSRSKGKDRGGTLENNAKCDVKD